MFSSSAFPVQFRHSQFKCIWCKMQTQNIPLQMHFLGLYTRLGNIYWYKTRLMVSAMSQPLKTILVTLLLMAHQDLFCHLWNAKRLPFHFLFTVEALLVVGTEALTGEGRDSTKYIQQCAQESVLQFKVGLLSELLWLLLLLSSKAENASEKWLLW